MFPEIKAFVEEFSDPPPRRPTYWIVLAADNNRWTQPGAVRGRWLTRQAAESAANKLASCWKWKVIVEIPGDAETTT